MSNQKNLTTNDTWFFGHPKGMVTLFFTEMWERMSYYGMRALLVLYMTGAVTGFNPGLGWSQVDAQAIYGIYVGMVYFMVIPGGWLADNVLGHQKAVLIGAIIIALGHFTLAMPLTETFFLGLILVVLGTGLLKGNISTIVGQLYKPGDSRVQAGLLGLLSRLACRVDRLLWRYSPSTDQFPAQPELTPRRRFP